MVEESVLKPGKVGEYAALVEKNNSCRKAPPELFKELISRQGFTHVFGEKWAAAWNCPTSRVWRMLRCAGPDSCRRRISWQT